MGTDDAAHLAQFLEEKRDRGKVRGEGDGK